MKHAGILIFSFLISLGSVAQITISGIITDSLSGKPIADANVVVKGTLQGTASDENGKFELRVRSLPVKIIISEIRHHTTEFIVTSAASYIRLAPKVQMLKEVSIHENRIQNIHPEPVLHAFDFEFYEDYILILAFKKSKKMSELLLIDENGKLILKKKLSVIPEGFYRDFMGNVHLLTADSAYQIYYDFQKIHLLYSLSKWDFMATMQQCKAEYNDLILINKMQFRGLESLYFAISETENKMFFSISDSAKRSYLERTFDIRYFINLRNQGVEEFMVSVKTLRRNLDLYRQMVGYDWLDSQILSPVNAPLYRVADTIYIFDYSHSEILQFDSTLALSRKIPIDFHKHPRWLKHILIDDTWNDIYTGYLKDGITHITKLNVKSFTPLESTEINGMIYIDKLRIRDGKAYFLYKNQFRNYNRMIYKMVL